ncbi:MAG: hypothetical protein ACLTY5_02725 [Angelakisella sp.]
MKKMSKILTFILVLAMVLSTVAMAEVGDVHRNACHGKQLLHTPLPPEHLTNGTITVKYSDGGKTISSLSQQVEP